jgi:ComF family protein
MHKPIVGEFFKDFLSLIYPRYCLACFDSMRRGEEIICSRCLLEMPLSDSFHVKENNLKTRLSYRLPLEYAFSCYVFQKDSRIQHLLHALKYRNQPEIGIKLGTVFGEKLRTGGFADFFQVIVPVPLHEHKLRKRGYNQSAKFAEGMAGQLKIPGETELLRRIKKTDTQTRKSKLHRWLNVKEGFEVVKPEEVYQKNVLLVDDVITTGATIEACGEALLSAGCNSLSVICIAEA